MKRRHAGLWSLIVPGILLVACASQAADPHYALATSANELFIFRDQGKWDTKSWSRLLSVSPDTSTLAGVATDGRYVYVADRTSKSLIVGTVSNLMGAPTWTEVATVALEDSGGTLKLKSPSHIAADRLGGVYVIGALSDDGSHSYFAHVKPTAGDWTTPVVSIGNLFESTMADVAVGKSGASAIIAHSMDTVTDTRVSHASKATEGLVSNTQSLSPKSFNARAVAIDAALGTDGYAYVVNNNADSPTTKGSVRVVDAATGAPRGSQAIELVPNMVPEDVTTFTIGTDHYLGIIGHDAGQQCSLAWKVLLDSNSDYAPAMSSVVSTPPSPSSATTGHQAAASSDGKLFWYVSETGTMGALDTTTWTGLDPLAFDGLVREPLKLENVTDYVPVAVPEPASLLSLAALLATSLAVCRRRR